METLTARVRFHPSRLTDTEIFRWRKQAKVLREKAPTFLDWLEDFLRVEQERRLRVLIGTYDEPQLPRLPFEMTNEDLANALLVISVFTYSAETYEAGRFFDELNTVLVTMTCNRLRNLEQWLE